MLDVQVQTVRFASPNAFGRNSEGIKENNNGVSSSSADQVMLNGVSQQPGIALDPDSLH